MTHERIFRRIAALLVSACDPERILLFGSYAKALENIDSDIDILVVGNFSGAPSLLCQELRQMFVAYPVRVDLHIATTTEMNVAANNPCTFPGSILSHSVCLYSRLGIALRPNGILTEIRSGNSI
jgi:predicted nucleotidyltransferase